MKKNKLYLKTCMDHKSILWNHVQDEKFEILTQYKPPRLCSILDLGEKGFDEDNILSTQKKYDNLVAFTLHLSDYFNFSSEVILDDVSSSPTLSLETFLTERLNLVIDGDTLKYPAVHVIKEKREIFENTALVYFEKDTLIPMNSWKLLYNSAVGMNSFINLSSLNKTKLESFNSSIL
ncbi:MAG: hypothetical protein IPK10_05395 [Bacteroidetes bacterium]|nr:hypothetical protein [Bacteroidota bacterium]